jgi:ankyrin repeat protein
VSIWTFIQNFDLLEPRIKHLPALQKRRFFSKILDQQTSFASHVVVVGFFSFLIGIGIVISIFLALHCCIQRSEGKMKGPCPEKTLLDLALHDDWTSAIDRARQHPKEIYHQRPFDGLNVLHMASGSKAPVDVFERFYEMNPQYFERAACSIDSRGMTPLLVACANSASLHVLHFLLQKTPPSAVQRADKDGWSALSFLACWPLVTWRTSDHVVGQGGGNLTLQESFLPLASTLLQIDQEMAIRPNKVGYTPLHLLVSTHQVELQFFYHYYFSSLTINNNANDFLLTGPTERSNSLHDLWRVIQLFVCSGNDTLNDATVNKNKDSSILHQCLAISSCPVLLVMLVCRMHHELLSRGDKDGNTPLHLAVRNKQSFLIPYLLNLQAEAADKVN